MNITRTLVFAPALLALVISGCSQPEDFTAPTLEPQFGTVADDIGSDVAISSTGQVYGVSQQVEVFPNYYAVYIYLRRYDSSGNMLWEQEVDRSFSGTKDLTAHAVYTDARGNGYVLFSNAYYVLGEGGDSYLPHRYSDLYQYDASGDPSGGSNVGPDCKESCSVHVAVDEAGNAYVARSGYEYDGVSEDSTVYKNVITNGSWKRPSTVGIPKDITVSPSGSIYVVGTKGMARYTNSGNLSWTKPGNFEEVIVSGSSIYTRYRKDIRKYDGAGKLLWLRSQSGLNTMVFQDMDGDGSGNVYLSGKYDADASDKRNMNAVVRKLNPRGSVLWTKTYGTPRYDDARGIATLSGSEIYVTGETQGSLAHANRGGPENRDGYLRKLNASGNPIWTR